MSKYKIEIDPARAKEIADRMNEQVKEAVKNNKDIYFIVNVNKIMPLSHNAFFKASLIINDHTFNTYALLEYVTAMNIKGRGGKIIFKPGHVGLIDFDLKYYYYDFNLSDTYTSNLLRGLEEIFNLQDYKKLHLISL